MTHHEAYSVAGTFCKRFGSEQGCSRGDKCPFLHCNPYFVPICKYYAAGACRFGDQCRFRHSRTLRDDLRARSHLYALQSTRMINKQKLYGHILDRLQTVQSLSPITACLQMLRKIRKWDGIAIVPYSDGLHTEIDTSSFSNADIFYDLQVYQLTDRFRRALVPVYLMFITGSPLILNGLDMNRYSIDMLACVSGSGLLMIGTLMHALSFDEFCLCYQGRAAQFPDDIWLDMEMFGYNSSLTFPKIDPDTIQPIERYEQVLDRILRILNTADLIDQNHCCFIMPHLLRLPKSDVRQRELFRLTRTLDELLPCEDGTLYTLMYDISLVVAIVANHDHKQWCRRFIALQGMNHLLKCFIFLCATWTRQEFASDSVALHQQFILALLMIRKIVYDLNVQFMVNGAQCARLMEFSPCCVHITEHRDEMLSFLSHKHILMALICRDVQHNHDLMSKLAISNTITGSSLQQLTRRIIKPWHASLQIPSAVVTLLAQYL